MTFDLSTIDIASPEHYEEHGYPHPEWSWLRQHAPLVWYERPRFDPFWAVTKHSDIVWLSKHPKLLQNAPRLAVFDNSVPPPEEGVSRHLLNMDPPDHAKYRQVASKRFTPRAVQGWEPKVRQITRDVIDAAAQREEIDFVKDVSAPITIAVIALMLGMPERDWPLIFRWTNEIIAPEDPEFQREGDKQKTLEGARMEVFAYFNDLAERRRRQPGDDIVSEVANGAVDGRALPPVELLSYLFLLVVAGNETTRNAMTGGMLAFLDNPGEWKRLQENRALVTPAIEEIVRWTTPVIQFCRTAAADLTLRGRAIRAGQSLCLFYPSANRDEEIFPDGGAFRIDRQPNDHVGFGRGEHVCLGAHLARLEIRAVFEELRTRLVRAELAGPVARVRSSFVGGIKRAPLRWEVAPGARG
ncbi:MAG TPA: cytochrome P450 [Myxococcota bacterium]|nr:cytochrome P450 [Myxococcota bacterium]